MPDNAHIESFFTDLRDTHVSGVGVKETSYYPYLYQVLKKWLSYRQRQVLGRDITKDEAREFTHIVRRIAALLLLEADLDKNYSAVKADCHTFSAAPSGTKEVV